MITHIHVTNSNAGFGPWTQVAILPAGASLRISPIDPRTIQYAAGPPPDEAENIVELKDVNRIGPFDKLTRIAVRVKEQPYTITAVLCD